MIDLALSKKPATKFGVCVTDSQGAINTQWCRPGRMWPFLLENHLRARGVPIRIATYGGSGATTTTALGAAHAALRDGYPDVGFIQLGVNNNISIARSVIGSGSASEVDVITAGGFGIAGSGWVLRIGNVDSAIVPASGATAAQVQAALQGMANVGSGNATVTGSAGGPWTVTFGGALTNTPIVLSARSADTTKELRALIKAFKFGAWGSWQRHGAQAGIEPVGPCFVATPSALPKNGRHGQRLVVLMDDASTAGCAPNARQLAAGLCVPNAGTTAGGNRLTVWEFRNSRGGIYGWGRVQDGDNQAATHTKKVVVIGANYQNSPAGDSPSTPFVPYVPIRTEQKAAADAEAVSVGGVPQVIYCDLYGYQRELVTSGAVPDFTSVSYDQAQSWLTSSTTQHENEYGQELRADAVLAGGPSAGSLGTPFPAAWITDLSA